jgi:hypothetical protein
MNQGRKQLFLGSDFFGKTGIDVDGGNLKVLDGTLSPSGEAL